MCIKIFNPPSLELNTLKTSDTLKERLKYLQTKLLQELSTLSTKTLRTPCNDLATPLNPLESCWWVLLRFFRKVQTEFWFVIFFCSISLSLSSSSAAGVGGLLTPAGRWNGIQITYEKWAVLVIRDRKAENCTAFQNALFWEYGDSFSKLSGGILIDMKIMSQWNKLIVLKNRF